MPCHAMPSMPCHAIPYHTTPYHTIHLHIDYFVESARVRYLLTSFLIQQQQVRKYRTKHFPCCNLFMLYLLRFFNPNQIFALRLAEQYQVMLSFRLSASTSLL